MVLASPFHTPSDNSASPQVPLRRPYHQRRHAQPPTSLPLPPRTRPRSTRRATHPRIVPVIQDVGSISPVLPSPQSLSVASLLDAAFRRSADRIHAELSNLRNLCARALGAGAGVNATSCERFHGINDDDQGEEVVEESISSPRRVIRHHLADRALFDDPESYQPSPASVYYSLPSTPPIPSVTLPNTLETSSNASPPGIERDTTNTVTGALEPSTIDLPSSYPSPLSLPRSNFYLYPDPDPSISHPHSPILPISPSSRLRLLNAQDLIGTDPSPSFSTTSPSDPQADEEDSEHGPLSIYIRSPSPQRDRSRSLSSGSLLFEVEVDSTTVVGDGDGDHSSKSQFMCEYPRPLTNKRQRSLDYGDESRHSSPGPSEAEPERSQSPCPHRPSKRRRTSLSPLRLDDSHVCLAADSLDRCQDRQNECTIIAEGQAFDN